MKARSLVLALGLWFTGTAVLSAQNPHMGKWKLNEQISTIPTGAVKNTVVVYEVQGANVKVTTDGFSKDGAPLHTEWVGKLDGRDYPITGDPAENMRSYKKVDGHTLALTNKKGVKVTTTGLIVVSEDGKSRTATLHFIDSGGNKVSSIAVYDKEE